MRTLLTKARRVRPVLLATLVFTALVACNDDNGPTDPPPPDITGSYALVTVNGAALPFIIEEDEEFAAQLVAGTLVLNQGTTCSAALDIEVIDKDTQEVVEELEEGGPCSYTVSGNTITLDFDDDDELTEGTISGTTITVTITGEDIVLVFEKV